MKTCYIIHKADNVEAVQGVAAAKKRKQETGGILVTGQKDLLHCNTSTLEAVYNGMVAVHGPEGFQPTKRFESKAKGAERLLKVLKAIFKTRKKTVATPDKRQRLPRIHDGRTGPRQGEGVYLPHKDFLKTPKPDSKRAAVLSAIAQPDGATFETLHGIIGGRRRNVNIFLQDLNRKCGYGITTVRVDGQNVYKLMGHEPDAGKKRKGRK